MCEKITFPIVGVKRNKRYNANVRGVRHADHVDCNKVAFLLWSVLIHNYFSLLAVTFSDFIIIFVH